MDGWQKVEKKRLKLHFVSFTAQKMVVCVSFFSILAPKDRGQWHWTSIEMECAIIKQRVCICKPSTDQQEIQQKRN